MTPTTQPREANPRGTNTPTDIDQVLLRYPLLTAHLVCESLGYMSPMGAASAILAHIRQQPFFCEWYMDSAGGSSDRVLAFGRRTLDSAFRRRRFHRGYMADFRHALQLVNAAIRYQDPFLSFQSW